jgi:toxin ParE1/3/4
MNKIVLKPEAESDLEKIYAFTFHRWGLQQAENYIDELYDGMQLLARQPSIGKPYLFSTTSYRSLHINSHILFYRTEESRCVIVRVLHDSMEIKPHI